MSFFGTFVLARSDTLLPQVPAVRAAFGSQFLAVHRYSNDWQLAVLNPPMWHEWPTIHGGPAPVAVVTGAPALAVEIKESACLQYGIATPEGPTWTAHFVDKAHRSVTTFRDQLYAAALVDAPTTPAARRCAFDYREECTVPLPGGTEIPDDDLPALADSLAAWAAAAGLSAGADRILEAIGTETDEKGVWGLVDALDLDFVETVEPLFTVRELGWRKVWHIGRDAGLRVFREWDTRRNGEKLAYHDRPRPGDDEFVRFLNLVAASLFGGGLTKDELLNEAGRLLQTYPEP